MAFTFYVHLHMKTQTYLQSSVDMCMVNIANNGTVTKFFTSQSRRGLIDDRRPLNVGGRHLQAIREVTSDQVRMCACWFYAFA